MQRVELYRFPTSAPDDVSGLAAQLDAGAIDPANVIAVLTIILGLVALARLPVAQYPNIVPPTVQVTARYPGASAATVVRDVALPIEQKVNGVEGMIYMSSMSTSDGSYTLTVTFRIGTDADKAQILVQNRVTSAQPALPQSVQTQGVQTAKRSTSILESRRRPKRGRTSSAYSVRPSRMPSATAVRAGST